MDLGGIDLHQSLGEQICLLLIVPFKADAVSRLDDRLKQGRHIGDLDNLVLCVGRRGLQPIPRAPRVGYPIVSL